MRPRTRNYCKQTRLRIRVSVAAYAYEILNQPIMSDAEYDQLAQRIDSSKLTGNQQLDEFFRQRYQPHTGMWIHDHPNKPGLANILCRVYGFTPRKKRRRKGDV